MHRSRSGDFTRSPMTAMDEDDVIVLGDSSDDDEDDMPLTGLRMGPLHWSDRQNGSSQWVTIKMECDESASQQAGSYTSSQNPDSSGQIFSNQEAPHWIEAFCEFPILNL